MKLIAKKVVKKTDANPYYKEFKHMIKTMKVLFAADWSTAYEKIVSDLSIPELEEMSKLAGGAQANKLIKAAKNFIVFVDKWNDSASEE